MSGVGAPCRVLADLSAYEDRRFITVGVLDAALNQLEIVYRELVALDTMGELNPGGATALQLGLRLLFPKFPPLFYSAIPIPCAHYSSKLM